MVRHRSYPLDESAIWNSLSFDQPGSYLATEERHAYSRQVAETCRLLRESLPADGDSETRSPFELMRERVTAWLRGPGQIAQEPSI